MITSVIVTGQDAFEKHFRYRRGLRTGANLVTINMTPAQLRNDYLLYKRERFIMNEERILDAISAEGLTPSTTSLVQFLHGSRTNGWRADAIGETVKHYPALPSAIDASATLQPPGLTTGSGPFPPAR